MNIVDFDPSKPVKTREGGEAEFACNLKSLQYPLGFKFTRKSGEQTITGFTAKGHYTNDDVEHEWDVVNIGPRFRITCWLNVYPTRVYAFQSKEQADAQAAFLAGRITCIDLNLDIPQP